MVEEIQPEFQGGRNWWFLFAVSLVIVAGVVFLYRAYQYGGYFTEDAYISFRFATNLAEGNGLVWNVGQEPVEGYTSPLHILLLAAGMTVGLSASATTQFLGFVSIAGLALLFVFLIRSETGGFMPLAAMLIGVYLIDAKTAIHATAGLDTPLYLFLLAANFTAGLAFVKSPGFRIAIALAAVNLLCLLGRPDAAPFIAGQFLVIGGFGLYGRVKNREPEVLRYAAISYGVLFVLGMLYLVWKYFYFGYLLPNPFYIKSNEYFSFRGLGDVREFVESLVTGYGFFLAPLLLLLDPVALKNWWAKPGSKAKTALLVVPAAAFLFYYTTVIHEVGYANRFEYPVYFFFCLGAAGLFSIGIRRFPPFGKLSAAAAALGAVIFLAAAYLTTSVHFPWFKIVETKYYGPIADALESTGLGPDGKLVFTSAGVVPYKSRFTHIDPVGLVDNQLSGRTGLAGVERERYIWDQDADVYIGPEPPASAGASDCGSDPLMRSDYMDGILGIYNSSPPYLNSYGKLSENDRCTVIHLRMRELRDRWELIGEIPYPVPASDGYTTFAYVRSESPHKEKLAKALGPLITRKPAEIDLLEVSGNGK